MHIHRIFWSSKYEYDKVFTVTSQRRFSQFSLKLSQGVFIFHFLRVATITDTSHKYVSTWRNIWTLYLETIASCCRLHKMSFQQKPDGVAAQWIYLQYISLHFYGKHLIVANRKCLPQATMHLLATMYYFTIILKYYFMLAKK